jgi:hypothetical protein
MKTDKVILGVLGGFRCNNGNIICPEKEKKTRRKRNTSNDYADELKINLMMH